MKDDVRLRAVVLKGFLPKLIGIKSKKLKNKSVILYNCCDVQSFGLRRNLDLAFVDRYGKTMKVVREFKPWSRCKCKGAKYVIERYSQRSRPWFKEGERLIMPKY